MSASDSMWKYINDFYDKRSGTKYNSDLFAPFWSNRSPANAFMMIVGSLIVSVVLPLVYLTTNADPSAVRIGMLIVFLWVLLGVFLRPRVSMVSRLVSGGIGLFFAFWTIFFFANFTDHGFVAMLSVFLWYHAVTVLLILGSGTAPLLLVMRLVQKALKVSSKEKPRMYTDREKRTLRQYELTVQGIEPNQVNSHLLQQAIKTKSGELDKLAHEQFDARFAKWKDVPSPEAP